MIKPEKKEKSIVVENLSKEFVFLKPEAKNALGLFKLFLNRDEIFLQKKAIQNISLEIHKGENIGLIGRNGSGKSTLLRLIAGIYSPDQGQIFVDGTLRFLSGFSLGLHRRLTARENIYSLGSLYGFNQFDVDEKIDEIIEFSELGDVIDEPLYSYSDGMISRLGFSVVFFLVEKENPDILLIDEALSGGGDSLFSEKVLKKIEQFIQGGSTVIIASHDLNFISKFCDRTVWLSSGNVKKIGESKKTVQDYKDFLKLK